MIPIFIHLHLKIRQADSKIYIENKKTKRARKIQKEMSNKKALILLNINM